MFDKNGLVESTLPTERVLADELFGLLDKEPRRPQRPPSIRLGFTGAPGVGKSTLIETLGMFLVEKHNVRLAVLVPSTIFLISTVKDCRSIINQVRGLHFG